MNKLLTKIRSGCFETNSSSVHSMTHVKSKDYSRWINGEGVMNIDGPDYHSQPIKFDNKTFLTYKEVNDALVANLEKIKEYYTDRYNYNTNAQKRISQCIPFDYQNASEIEKEVYNKFLMDCFSLYTNELWVDEVYNNLYGGEIYAEKVNIPELTEDYTAFGYAGRDS